MNNVFSKNPVVATSFSMCHLLVQYSGNYYFDNRKKVKIYYQDGTNKKAFFFRYSQESMLSAIAACRGGMPSSTAARTFSVPRNTLKNKVKGKTKVERKMGPATVLSTKEEKALVKCIIDIHI